MLQIDTGEIIVDLIIILVSVVFDFFVFWTLLRYWKDRKQYRAFIEAMTTTNSLSDDEFELINNYRMLNASQQRKIRARIEKMNGLNDEMEEPQGY